MVPTITIIVLIPTSFAQRPCFGALPSHGKSSPTYLVRRNVSWRNISWWNIVWWWSRGLTNPLIQGVRFRNHNHAKDLHLARLYQQYLLNFVNIYHHQTIIETNRSTWSTRAVSSLGSMGWLALFALFVIIRYRIITIIHLGSTG